MSRTGWSLGLSLALLLCCLELCLASSIAQLPSIIGLETSRSNSILLGPGNSHLLLESNGTAHMKDGLSGLDHSFWGSAAKHLTIEGPSTASLVVDMQDIFYPLNITVRHQEGEGGDLPPVPLGSPDHGNFSLTNIPSHSKLELKHRNSSSVAILVGDPDAYLQSTSTLEVHSSSPRALTLEGHARELILDFGAHFSLTSPVFVDTESRGTEEILVLSSASGDFQRTELSLPLLEAFHLIGGPHDDEIVVRRIPQWFNASVTLIGRDGFDSVALEESLVLPRKALTIDADALSIKANLNGACPVSLTLTQDFSLTTPCSCTGMDSIFISADSVTVTAPISTEEGDITINCVTDLLLGNDVVTSSGDISFSAGDTIVASAIRSTSGRLEMSSPTINLNETVDFIMASPMNPQLHITANGIEASIVISDTIRVKGDIGIEHSTSVATPTGINILGDVNCEGSISLSSDGSTTALLLNGSLLSSGNISVILDGVTKGMSLHGCLVADGVMSIDATANGNLALETGSNSAMRSGGNMNITATGGEIGVSITGTVASGANMSISVPDASTVGVQISGTIEAGEDLTTLVTGAITGINLFSGGHVEVEGDLIWSAFAQATGIRLDGDIDIRGGETSLIRASCDSGTSVVGLEIVSTQIDCLSDLDITTIVDGGITATGILCNEGALDITMHNEKDLTMTTMVGNTTPPEFGEGLRIVSSSGDVIYTTFGTGSWIIASDVRASNTSNAMVFKGLDHTAETINIDFTGTVTTGSSIRGISLDTVVFSSNNNGTVTLSASNVAPGITSGPVVTLQNVVMTDVANSNVIVSVAQMITSVGRSFELLEGEYSSVGEFSVEVMNGALDDGVYMQGSSIEAQSLSLTSEARGGRAAAVRLEDMSVSVDGLTITGTSFAPDSLGIVFDRTRVDGVQRAVLRGNGGIMGSSGNHGIHFVGTSSLTGELFELYGDSRQSAGSHGVYINPGASLTLNGTPSSRFIFTCVTRTPNSITGDSNHAFLVEGMLDVRVGNLHVVGNTNIGDDQLSGSHTCFFRQAVLNVSLGAAVTLDCDSEDGPLMTHGIVFEISGVKGGGHLCLSGIGSGRGGDGILWNATNVAIPTVLSGSGGLSETNSNVGVRITGSDSSFENLTISGIGGGIDCSLHSNGVEIDASIAAAVLIINGTASVGASHGVLIIDDIVATGCIEITGVWQSSSKATMDPVSGVEISNSTVTSNTGTITIDGESDSSYMHSTGVAFTATVLTTPSVVSVEGEGHLGISFEDNVDIQNAAASFTGLATGAQGSTGVAIAGELSSTSEVHIIGQAVGPTCTSGCIGFQMNQGVLDTTYGTVRGTGTGIDNSFGCILIDADLYGEIEFTCTFEGEPGEPNFSGGLVLSGAITFDGIISATTDVLTSFSGNNLFGFGSDAHLVLEDGCHFSVVGTFSDLTMASSDCHGVGMLGGAVVFVGNGTADFEGRTNGCSDDCSGLVFKTLPTGPPAFSGSTCGSTSCLLSFNGTNDSDDAGVWLFQASPTFTATDVTMFGNSSFGHGVVLSTTSVMTCEGGTIDINSESPLGSAGVLFADTSAVALSESGDVTIGANTEIAIEGLFLHECTCVSGSFSFDAHTKVKESAFLSFGDASIALAFRGGVSVESGTVVLATDTILLMETLSITGTASSFRTGASSAVTFDSSDGPFTLENDAAMFDLEGGLLLSADVTVTGENSGRYSFDTIDGSFSIEFLEGEYLISLRDNVGCVTALYSLSVDSEDTFVSLGGESITAEERLTFNCDVSLDSPTLELNCTAPEGEIIFDASTFETTAAANMHLSAANVVLLDGVDFGHTGQTIIRNGTSASTASIDGSIAGPLHFEGSVSATFQGTALVQDVSAGPGSVITVSSGLDCLDMSSSQLLIGDSAKLLIEITPNAFQCDGYDGFMVSSVDLGSDCLLEIVGIPDLESNYTIISASSPIVGTFSGLPEGHYVSTTGRSVRISYENNAVTLFPNMDPIAVDDTYELQVMSMAILVVLPPGVALNDSATDDDLNDLSCQVVDDPSVGDLQMDGDCGFMFNPLTAPLGTTAVFTYRLVDPGGALSNTATVTLLIGSSTPTPTPTQTPSGTSSTSGTSTTSATRSPSSSTSMSRTVSLLVPTRPSSSPSRPASPSQRAALLSVTPTVSRAPSLSRTPSRGATRPLPPAPESPVPATNQVTLLPSIAPLPSRAGVPSLSPCVTGCVDDFQAVLDDDDRDFEITSNGEGVGTVAIFDAQPVGTVLVIGPGSSGAEDALPRPGSIIVDISLQNSAGKDIQPEGTVEICLEMNDSDVEDSGCLGFFDHSSGKWVCEDPCLDISDGQACGQTDHFTNFALLLSGGEGSGSGGPCGSSSFDYIFDAAWKDAILVGSFGIAACVIVSVIVVVFLAVKPLSRIHGKEYLRIRTMRTVRESGNSAI